MYGSSHFFIPLPTLGFVRFKIIAVEVWSDRDEGRGKDDLLFLIALPPKSEKCLFQWIYIDAM